MGGKPLRFGFVRQILKLIKDRWVIEVIAKNKRGIDADAGVMDL